MNEPLAQRMRPKTLAEVCGQQHLLAPGRGASCCTSMRSSI